ncbi:hypothetical protein EYC80_003178 [Monilinia laxa]|uniref:Uncharacterized protein n=1 Tax=Monilinia laxa TaxID=61186 RepID=A0A5N6KD13_MONLA|nr:hypothetical protein EYC80_003178 [Monilinia laxa]
MSFEFKPPLALKLERNNKIEDENLERSRVISLYIMMFLSMASPILHESYLLAWYIDLLSTLGFMITVVLTHPKEIKKFGPVILPIAGLLSVIVFANRVSLLETMPWMPFAISMWLLITVYSCPALASLIHEVIQESGQGFSKHGCYFHNVTRDIEEDQCQSADFDLNQRIPLQSTSMSAINRGLAFMGRPASHMSTNSSDIDLDEGNAMAKFFVARFLSHTLETDSRLMSFPKEVRFHSRDLPMHGPEIPDDSLIGHYSRIEPKTPEHT